MIAIGSNNFLDSFRKGGFQFWFGSALIALFIPLVGVLCLIYLLLRLRDVDQRRKLVIVLWIALFTVIGSFSYYLLFSHLHDSQPYTKNYSQINFVPHKVLGPFGGNGTSISFLRPTDFISPLGANKTTSTTNEPLLVQRPLERQQYSISTIRAVPNILPEAEKDLNYLDKVDKAMFNTQDPLHEQIRNNLEKFLKAASTPKAFKSIISNKPERLTTENISQHAWTYDLKISKDGDGEGFKNGEVASQGRVALLYGKKTYYYFVVYSTVQNWQKNTETWQKIFNSIKIDQ